MKLVRKYIDRMQRRMRGEQMGPDEGFSLAELIVVVAIIAILAAVAVPMYMGQQEKAKVNGALTEMRAAKTALSSYIADKGHPVEPTYTVDAAILEGFGVSIGASNKTAIDDLTITRQADAADGSPRYTFSGTVAGVDNPKKTCSATLTDPPSCS